MGAKLAYEYVQEASAKAPQRPGKGDSIPAHHGRDTIAARARFALESLALVLPFWFVVWASVSWARFELSFSSERLGSFLYLWPDLLVPLVGLPVWAFAVVADPRVCAARRSDRLLLLQQPMRRLLLLYLCYSVAVYLLVDAHRSVALPRFFETHGLAMFVGIPLVGSGFYKPYFPKVKTSSVIYSGYRMLTSDEAAAMSRTACLEHVRKHLRRPV